MAKKFKTVFGKQMAYVEEGRGDTFVFLHGNPTSSYLWRNIIRDLKANFRCIAPDLIGMGDSEKLDNPIEESYSFVEQKKYLFRLLKAIDIKEKFILVLHDWGSALGFDYARNNPNKIKGVVYMEAIVQALTWQDWPENARGIFKAIRSSAGEELILKKNIFVEKILPASIIRELSENEFYNYKKPFLKEGSDRMPTLSWPRQIPLEGRPSNVCDIVCQYSNFMKSSDINKLFINAMPGSILIGKQREFCRKWKNQKEVTVKGIHFIQEDSSSEIADFINLWYNEVFSNT